MNIVKDSLDIKVLKWTRAATPAEIRTVVSDLRNRREVNGIKQGDVAKMLDVFQSHVSALETGGGTESVKFTARYITVMRKVLNIGE